MEGPQRASEQNSGGWARDHTWGLSLGPGWGSLLPRGQRMGIIWGPGTPGTRPRVVTLLEGHGSSVGSCWTDRLGTEEGPREESGPVCGPQEPSLEPNALKAELRGQRAPSSSHLRWGQEGCRRDVARAPEAEEWQLGAARVKARGSGQPRAPRPPPRGGCTPIAAACTVTQRQVLPLARM